VTRRPSRWHGVLPVYKNAGPTSHDVVDMARRALRERRIGHTGTLDPMAEGLLLLCIGQAARLQQYLMRWEKSYRGQLRLGNATTTYDIEGKRMDPQGDPPSLDRSELDRLERLFKGVITQVPPPYSAKKVAGKKLYELARSGQQPTVEPKQVTVHDLRLVPVEPDLLTIDVKASTGFYVRTLAHDLGIEIGCGAHLHHLCRAAIGPYVATDALAQQTLETVDRPESIIDGPAWIPIDEVTLPFPAVALNTSATERFVHGQEVIVFRAGQEPLQSGSEVAVRDPGDQLLGVGTVQAVLARGRTVSLRPTVVLQRSRVQSTVARGETS
jgi:tRNA pseudouridine55 synthase